MLAPVCLITVANLLHTRRGMRGCEVESFRSEWSGARQSVLRDFSAPGPIRGDGGELALLSRVPTDRWEEMLRAVRSESRRVAERFRERVGRRLSVDEVAQALSESGIACFRGPWRSESHGFSRYLYRGECRTGRAGRSLCDYWREVAAGATEGLGGAASFAAASHCRHPSR